tara:strand:- start:117 stop:686 length:570 start_codon:yes stop_codon:yes gene_type:complete
MKKLISILSLLILINACQPIEKIEQVVFDNNQLSKFNIHSEKIEIIDLYENKFSDPYIGYSLKISPSQRIINWVKDNFNAVGNENKFSVIILEASLTQNQFKNSEAKNFNEKNNYKYELFYLVEFNLYDDSNNLIASTLVEASRSTTSAVYISIQQRERIINDLISQSLFDLSNQSNELIIKYMGKFIL